MSGQTIVAPGATVTRTRTRRATAVTGNLLLAMALVLAIPFGFAVIAALIELVVKAVRLALFA